MSQTILDFRFGFDPQINQKNCSIKELLVKYTKLLQGVKIQSYEE